ncbi:MAG: sigma-70 family RNA polymerase sigma factor [Myxococcota bacterium]
MADAETFAATLARAREEHPGIAVSDDTIEAWVRARLPDGISLDDAAVSHHVADLALACGCAAADATALSIFERTLTPVLAAAVQGAGARADEVDEAVQRIRERLLVDTPQRPARIAGYRGDGPLRGWLRVCAVREVLSERRKQQPEALTDDNAIADVVGIDPELEVIKDNASAEFRAAFREALAELPAREKNILRYHALEGLTGDEVGRIYKVDRSTVSRWLAKARHQLLQGTRKRLTLKLKMDRKGFESLMDLIASRLDVSLGGLKDLPDE